MNKKSIYNKLIKRITGWWKVIVYVKKAILGAGANPLLATQLRALLLSELRWYRGIFSSLEE